MNKSDLFRQVGWSQELIDHFTIEDDTADTECDMCDYVPQTFEASTATIRYSDSSDGRNINIIIP